MFLEALIVFYVFKILSKLLLLTLMGLHYGSFKNSKELINKLDTLDGNIIIILTTWGLFSLYLSDRLESPVTFWEYILMINFNAIVVLIPYIFKLESDLLLKSILRIINITLVVFYFIHLKA